MPIYTYKCPKCGEIKDVFYRRRFEQDWIVTCNKCAWNIMERILVTSFIFYIK